MPMASLLWENTLSRRRETAAMLAECTEEPLSFKEQFRLMSRGIVEHDAHFTYLGIKGRLYEAARSGYGFSN